MVYVGVGGMLIFTLMKVIKLKKILNKKLELEEIDQDFVNAVNSGGE